MSLFSINLNMLYLLRGTPTFTVILMIISIIFGIIDLVKTVKEKKKQKVELAESQQLELAAKQ